jgi:hypothetical protein
MELKKALLKNLSKEFEKRLMDKKESPFADLLSALDYRNKLKK